MNTFECSCLQYYTGLACDKSLKPCDQNPCLNGAQCIEFLDATNSELTFKCNCTKQFEGTRCETKINVCSNITCSGKLKISIKIKLI